MCCGYIHTACSDVEYAPAIGNELAVLQGGACMEDFGAFSLGIEQIDSAFLDATNNGLTYAVEKFKPYELAGHVSLQKGERSAVATLAAQVL